MKSSFCVCISCIVGVAPLVGVWIEIIKRHCCKNGKGVAPLVGVWIEIKDKTKGNVGTGSLPSWECGLKLPGWIRYTYPKWVAPLVGVWIEIVELVKI